MKTTMRKWQCGSNNWCGRENVGVATWKQQLESNSVEATTLDNNVVQATLWRQQCGRNKVKTIMWKGQCGSNNTKAKTWKGGCGNYKQQCGSHNVEVTLWKQQHERNNLVAKMWKLQWCSNIIMHILASLQYIWTSLYDYIITNNLLAFLVYPKL